VSRFDPVLARIGKITYSSTCGKGFFLGWQHRAVLKPPGIYSRSSRFMPVSLIESRLVRRGLAGRWRNR
jgi:hypothetical protein